MGWKRVSLTMTLTRDAVRIDDGVWATVWEASIPGRGPVRILVAGVASYDGPGPHTFEGISGPVHVLDSCVVGGADLAGEFMSGPKGG